MLLMQIFEINERFSDFRSQNVVKFLNFKNFQNFYNVRILHCFQIFTTMHLFTISLCMKLGCNVLDFDSKFLVFLFRTYQILLRHTHLIRIINLSLEFDYEFQTLNHERFG